ncbi:GIY-YIG nuclease family protein [Burkholderia latens]|uniref:GIY-YIG nuclease family protein n=1 Tax=Burkholderia latens TaxID=488446 RepID=UPI001C975852|nr:GIY-YIG nuclease family protein [Burkholderia latens]MBY4697333.1 GIY-YIG nuclease family protein [Burkholderia latens]
MSWFLYLIECADDSVYTGITTDVSARFDEHASGKGARYTRSRKPRAVLASFPLPDRSIASRAEYWVKRLTAAQKRELAAGIRTLDSVLPVGMSIAAHIDASGLPAGPRARKAQAKPMQAGDVAAQAAETKRTAKNTAKAAKTGDERTTSGSAPTKAAKRVQSAPAPAKAKGATAAPRANTGDGAEARKTASRRTAAKQDKPAARAASKRTMQATGGKPAGNEHAGATRAPRTKAAADSTPDAAAVRAPVRARKKAAARAAARTKQNRAAS